MCYSKSLKAQETVTVPTVFGVCTSPGMERSYLVPGGNILFRTSFLKFQTVI